MTDAGEPSTRPTGIGLGDRSTGGRRVITRIVVRVIVSVAAVAIASFVLVRAFEDIDFEQIHTAIGRMSDAQWIALVMGWVIWVGCQGFQTGSLVTDLPVRRGTLAFLGPTAIASLIPGPSDLPVRYSMFRSWGTTSEDAGTAVAASGIFSIGSQLILPAIAGVVITVGGIQVEGFLSVIVAATVVLAVVIVLGAVVLGSEQRTRTTANWLDRGWRRIRRVFRRSAPDERLGDVAVRRRDRAAVYLRGKWLRTIVATTLATGAKCSLLILTLRFAGVPEQAIGWPSIFAVFALVAGLTVVPITPGSAGVAEIGLVAMLTPIAGNGFVNQVVAGVAIYRIMTWILVIPAGFTALAIWRRSNVVVEKVGGDAV